MPLASRSYTSPFGSTPDLPKSDLEVLLVDGAAETEGYVTVLREHYRTNVTTHQRTAIQYMQRAIPALVVAGLKLDDGSAVEICREAKLMPTPASVLVIAEDPQDVPDVLTAGCDGVLLKPFAPSLFVNRISRILRVRSEQLRLQAARSRGKSAHLFERAESLRTGTNHVWPSEHCPKCLHQGVTSFDYASMRRAWYACLQCRHVWMAKRLDS